MRLSEKTMGSMFEAMFSNIQPISLVNEFVDVRGRPTPSHAQPKPTDSAQLPWPQSGSSGSSDGYQPHNLTSSSLSRCCCYCSTRPLSRYFPPLG